LLIGEQAEASFEAAESSRNSAFAA